MILTDDEIRNAVKQAADKRISALAKLLRKDEAEIRRIAEPEADGLKLRVILLELLLRGDSPEAVAAALGVEWEDKDEDRSH